MKKIMWAISFISLIGTVIVLQFMPDRIPMHYDMAGNIDRWGSKYESLIFPILILAISLLWTFMIEYFEKKEQKATDEKQRADAKTNAKVIKIVGVSMAAMFTIVQGFIMYGSYHEAISNAEKQTIDISKVATILMGIIFIVLGNFMTKIRANGAVGFRVSWSMYNENTWRKSNRFAATMIMIVGGLTIITAAVMRNSFGAMMIMLGYLFISIIVASIYAHKVYKKEIAEGR